MNKNFYKKNKNVLFLFGMLFFLSGFFVKINNASADSCAGKEDNYYCDDIPGIIGACHSGVCGNVYVGESTSTTNLNGCTGKADGVDCDFDAKKVNGVYSSHAGRCQNQTCIRSVVIGVFGNDKAICTDANGQCKSQCANNEGWASAYDCTKQNLKCCIPSSNDTSSADSSSSDNTSLASSSIYPSQCAMTSASGSQSGCSHDNDTAILKNQCTSPHFSSSQCSSMSSYLSAMKAECEVTKPSGVDCSKISAGGYYGSEANKYANFIKNDLIPTDNSRSGYYSATSGNQTFDQSLDTITSRYNLPDPQGGVGQVVKNFLFWLISIFGIIALIAFVISGLQYMLAAGEEKTIATAKKNMTYSIIGVIVALSGLVVIQAVNYALNARSVF